MEGYSIPLPRHKEAAVHISQYYEHLDQNHVSISGDLSVDTAHTEVEIGIYGVVGTVCKYFLDGGVREKKTDFALFLTNRKRLHVFLFQITAGQ